MSTESTSGAREGIAAADAGAREGIAAADAGAREGIAAANPDSGAGEGIGAANPGRGARGALSALPTAPLAAAGLIAGFAVARGTGSRPLGGVVLAGLGLGCIAVWLGRDGRAVAAKLTGVGLGMFAVSHGLGLVIGAWPSVLISAGVVALACDRLSDARARRARRGA